jgi:hypothetical protein
MMGNTPSGTRTILLACLVAAVGVTGPLASESGIEMLPPNRADVELPDARHSPLRVQVQLVWDGAAGRLDRRRYEFADPFPAQYDVHYLPLDPANDRPGRISGRGIMTWRAKGDARFGKDSIIAQYRGGFANGYFEGEGALLMRGGLRYDGGWKSGRMEGHGQLLLPDGDAYTGDFLAGKQHGQGQYISATGQVYEGGFAVGLRDGMGTVTEPGRAVYSSVWRGGREELSLRQMLPGQIDLAQSTDSAPDLAVSVSATANNSFCCGGTKAVLGYVSTSYPDHLRIFPDAPQMLDIWRGKENIVVQNAGSFDWERYVLEEYSFRNYFADGIVPVGLQLGVENMGTAAASIVGSYLDVSESELDGEPALQSLPLKPLSPQSLSFSIENYGWATAEKAKLSFSYLKPQSGEKSERLEIPIGDLKSVHEFSFVETMQKMGADAARLPALEEECINSKNDGTEAACLKKVKESGALGKLTEFLFSDESSFELKIEGNLDYGWRDNSGTLVSKSVPFASVIPIGSFASFAECEGAGEENPIEPPKPFELKIGEKNYRLPLPIKGEVGQGVLKRWGIKINAAKSSRHRFTIVFELADGRQVRSRPIDLEFFRPQSFPESIRPFQPRC